MKVYELMAFLADKRADAEVMVYGGNLMSSIITSATDEIAGPDTVHLMINPEFYEEDA